MSCINFKFCWEFQHGELAVAFGNKAGELRLGGHCLNDLKRCVYAVVLLFHPPFELLSGYSLLNALAVRQNLLSHILPGPRLPPVQFHCFFQLGDSSVCQRAVLLEGEGEAPFCVLTGPLARLVEDGPNGLLQRELALRRFDLFERVCRASAFCVA